MFSGSGQDVFQLFSGPAFSLRIEFKVSQFSCFCLLYITLSCLKYFSGLGQSSSFCNFFNVSYGIEVSCQLLGEAAEKWSLKVTCHLARFSGRPSHLSADLRSCKLQEAENKVHTSRGAITGPVKGSVHFMVGRNEWFKMLQSRNLVS